MTKFTVMLVDPANQAGAFAARIVAAVQAAADNWGAYINSTATIDISIDIQNLGSVTIAQGGSSTHFSPDLTKPFVIAPNDVIAKLTSGIDQNGAAVDLRIDLNQIYINKLTYDLTQTAVLGHNEEDAVSVFTHEIGHGIGFSGFLDPLSGAVQGGLESTFDQFVQNVGGNLYFTGANAEAVYHGPVPIEHADYGHVGNAAPLPGADLMSDLMFGTIQSGVHKKISALDLAILKDIGVPVSATIPPPPPPPPPAADNFSITDNTTGAAFADAGAVYGGPVAGLKFQYVYTGADNINVTSGVAGEFIHTGSGIDAIDVHLKGGSNVLDGGTSSNFLVGGTATTDSDTFFIDDRLPPSDIWSTVANFHAGDAATIFGITQNGFATSWVDGQGAAGFTGLTLHVSAPSVPTASVTLAGYTTADLGNGRLSQVFGTEADGTPYLYIHGDR